MIKAKRRRLRERGLCWVLGELEGQDKDRITLHTSKPYLQTVFLNTWTVDGTDVLLDVGECRSLAKLLNEVADAMENGEVR